MVKCQSCGRENDSSFTFCLDCGAELNPSAAAPAPTASTPDIPESAPAAPTQESAQATEPEPVMEPEPITEPEPIEEPEPVMDPEPVAAPTPTAAPEPEPEPAPAAAPTPAEETNNCPKCGAAVTAGNAFCSGCGQKMGEEPAGSSTMFMHVASPEAEQEKHGRLILIKPDGTEGTVFTIAEKTAIGRSQGLVMFPKDPYISPKHAELYFENGELSIQDLNSLNGIYYKIKTETQIYPGTYFRTGRQLLRLEVPGDFQDLGIEVPEGDDSTFWGSPPPQVWARLVQVLEGGKIGEIHLLSQAEVMIGREDGAIRFPEDGFISSRHCLLVNQDGDCKLKDLGSSNGTYMRIRDRQVLASGDRIQIGNQVLKVDVS